MPQTPSQLLRDAGANGIYNVLSVNLLPCKSGQKEINTLMHVHVACAIIERDGLVLAARRNAFKSLPLKWEFPGGKIDPGESAEACIIRELFEEMGISVDIRSALPPSTHHYADFSVTLYPVICAMVSGKIALNEHTALMWLSPEELYSLDWADADFPVIDSYLQRLRGRYYETPIA